MIRIRRQARLTALRASLLQAASVEGLRSISSRMCAICFTALAPHSTSAVRSLCSLIDQCRTHSRSRAVNQRGCSPLRTLFLIAPVFLSRRTLARRGRAAAPRSRKPTAHKAQACGLASSKHDNIVITVLKAQRRLKNKEREGSINATIHCSYFTHTQSHSTLPCIFSFTTSEPTTCVFSFGRHNRSHLLLSSGIPIWVTFGVFNLTTNWRLYLFKDSSV